MNPDPLLSNLSYISQIPKYLAIKVILTNVYIITFSIQTAVDYIDP